MDLFKNPASSIPTSDAQIVRVSMEEIEIQGRKSALPAQQKSGALTIAHVPSNSAIPGVK